MNARKVGAGERGPHRTPRWIARLPWLSTPSRRTRGPIARLPLRWRLALGYALVLLLVLAPLAAVQASAVHAFLVDDAATALRAATHADANGGHGAKAPRGIVPTLDPIDTTTRNAAGPDMTALLVTATGQVLSSATGPNGRGVTPARLLNRSLLQRAASTGADQTYQASTDAGPYLVAVAPLPLPKGHGPRPAPAASPASDAAASGLSLSAPRAKAKKEPPVANASAATAAPRQLLLLARSMAPIDATATRVWLLAVVGTALALLVATGLGALLIRRALRPLTRLAVAADDLAAGDYARRVPAPVARDEVGQLSVAFNTMAAAVDDAFATQRRFVADAAHELRSPLTALGGYADVLLLGAAANPRDLMAALETMRGETRRMTRLVNDLLLLARFDASATGTVVTMQETGVDLAALLRDVYAGAHVAASDRVVRLDVPSGPVVVRGDRDRLHQVISNLLDNAVKFTGAGGQIGLSLRRDGRVATLEVCDDGVGIAPEDLPRVCERFYRADEARSRATGGAGLGLSIVQAIVAAHHGDVRLHSTLGRGSTVVIRLPLASDPGPA